MKTTIIPPSEPDAYRIMRSAKAHGVKAKLVPRKPAGMQIVLTGSSLAVQMFLDQSL